MAKSAPRCAANQITGTANQTRRTAKQSEHLKAQINELDLQGYTQTQIAEQLGISQQMVSHYLQQIEAEVLQRIIPNRCIARQRQIDEIRLLKRNTWETIKCYERELEEHPEDCLPIWAAISRERRFLLDCNDRENKLQGLYEKHDLTTQATPEDDLSQDSREDLEAMLAYILKQQHTTPEDGRSMEVL